MPKPRYEAKPRPARFPNEWNVVDNKHVRAVKVGVSKAAAEQIARELNEAGK